MRVFLFCLCFAGTWAFSILSSEGFQGKSSQQSELLLDKPSEEPNVISLSTRPDSSQMADAALKSGAQLHQEVSVTCGETALVVRIKNNFYGFGFHDARLTLGPSCGNNSVDLITGELLFSYNLQDCDSQRMIIPGYTIYRNILYYIPSQRSGKVGGVPRINVEIECSYKSDWYDGSVFSLQLMNSAWTASSLTNVYSTGDLLHFQARGYPNTEGEQLFIGSCYATLSENPQSFPQYMMIDNYGCMNHKLGASSKFHQPRADGVINFAIDARELNLVSKIYVHCVLFLCIQGTTVHTKSCNFDATKQRWEGLELVDGVCDCCESNCTAPLLTSITTDVKSTGPIFIQEGTAKRTSPTKDADLLWFQVKGGDAAYLQDEYDRSERAYEEEEDHENDHEGEHEEYEEHGEYEGENGEHEEHEGAYEENGDHEEHEEHEGEHKEHQEHEEHGEHEGEYEEHEEHGEHEGEYEEHEEHGEHEGEYEEHHEHEGDHEEHEEHQEHEEHGEHEGEYEEHQEHEWEHEGDHEEHQEHEEHGEHEGEYEEHHEHEGDHEEHEEHQEHEEHGEHEGEYEEHHEHEGDHEEHEEHQEHEEHGEHEREYEEHHEHEGDHEEHEEHQEHEDHGEHEREHEDYEGHGEHEGQHEHGEHEGEHEDYDEHGEHEGEHEHKEECEWLHEEVQYDEPAVESLNEETKVETVNHLPSDDASQVDNQREASGTKISMLEVSAHGRGSLQLKGSKSNVSQSARITLDAQGDLSLQSVP
ncbi:uncharacterized protein LOC136763371 [Amia ocellicauda]|uniref:uncharacterized protein LOC136763371 n=1 Tax=Amia ocellicauda TaxID=2972642 RepID=UPI003463CA23